MLLQPGEIVEIPSPQTNNITKKKDLINIDTGNAGGIILVFKGISYGPLGESGKVKRNIEISEEYLSTHFKTINDPQVDKTIQEYIDQEG